MKENLPSEEFSEEERTLIARLREKGVGDAETREALVRWCEGEEEKAAAINTSRANIELDLKKATLYRAAGFRDEAWESLESARLAAHNEGDEELRRKADAMMDAIDEESKS